MTEDKTFYIRKLNELDKPPLNKYDKRGYHLLKMLDFYGVYGIQDLTLEQIKTYYEREKENDKR